MTEESICLNYQGKLNFCKTTKCSVNKLKFMPIGSIRRQIFMVSEKENFQSRVLFFCPQGLPEVYAQVIETDKKSKKHEFEEISSTGSADDLLVLHENASVLFCITSKDDLVQLLTFCKINVEKIRQGVLKVGGLNLTGSHKLDDVLKKSGVSDVFLDSISSKTLDYKLNFWNKGIQTNLKKIQSSLKGNFKFDNKAAGANAKEGEGNKGKSGGKVNVLSALSFSSDCWLLENVPEQPRKVMGHWIIELIGPSPYAGRWLEIKGGDASSDPLWEWNPLHVEEFQFIEHEGCWVAKGKQPQFSWKTNSWKFIGQSPALFFRLKGADPVVRFVINDDDNLEIAEDSKYAQAKKRLIEESFDPKVVQKKDNDNSKENLEEDLDDLVSKASLDNKNNADDIKELELLASKEALKLDDLTGKGSTDKIANSGLKGKISTESGAETDEDMPREGSVDKLNKNLAGKLSRMNEKIDSSLEGETKGNKKELEGGTKKQDKNLVDKTKSKNKKGIGHADADTNADDDLDDNADDDLDDNDSDGIIQNAKGSRDLKKNNSTKAISDLANEIKLKKEDDAKKKESSTQKNKTLEGLLGGKFKTLKEDDQKGPKDTKIELELEKAKKSIPKAKELLDSLLNNESDQLDLDGDVASPSIEVEKNKREKEKKTQNKSLSDLVKKEKDLGHSKKTKSNDEKDNDAHQAVNREIDSNMAGSGATSNIEEDPLSGEGAEADRLSKFLHGKSSWKEEAEKHLRITDLRIELLMKSQSKKEEISVKLGDIVENILVVFVPLKKFKYNEKAEVKVFCSYGAMNIDFKVSGSIVDMYENDDETECCNIELSEYNEANLKQLKRLSGDRQRNISNFLKQAKGVP